MPRTIAVIGANNNPARWSNRCVRDYIGRGWQVFPVNVNGEPVEGLTTYRTVSEVPVERLDRISLYVNPKVGIELLDEISRKPHDELWLNPGAESPDLLAKAEELGLEPILACTIVDG